MVIIFFKSSCPQDLSSDFNSDFSPRSTVPLCLAGYRTLGSFFQGKQELGNCPRMRCVTAVNPDGVALADVSVRGSRSHESATSSHSFFCRGQQRKPAGFVPFPLCERKNREPGKALAQDIQKSNLLSAQSEPVLLKLHGWQDVPHVCKYNQIFVLSKQSTFLTFFLTESTSLFCFLQLSQSVSAVSS